MEVDNPETDSAVMCETTNTNGTGEGCEFIDGDQAVEGPQRHTDKNNQPSGSTEPTLSPEEMLGHLAQTDAHFKSQQRGEPELSVDEKYQIALDKLNKNPVNFLSQFHKFLRPSDLDYFEQFKGNYEIDFYLKEIRRCAAVSVKQVKNRRYMAMQKLLDDGDYFSEDEMKYRAPLLYEELIGKYLTDDEVQQRVDKTDLKFSSILLKHIDQLEENKHYYNQKMIQDEQVEDDDDVKSEEEDESELESEGEDSKPTISIEDKENNKAEFLYLMKERFLTGEDKPFFDYSSVDTNTDYDSLDTINQDAEDKYFDED